MAVSKLHQIEKQEGKTIREILTELYSKHDTQSAVAKELGISQGTLHVWLLKCGLREKTTLVEAHSQPAEISQ